MRWLRRNALPLAALAVLIPGSVVVVGGHEWITYNGFRPISPIDVAGGDTAEFAGATFGPARLTDATDVAQGLLPTDAKVLRVEIPVVPGGEPPACLLTLREAEGEGRHWEPQPYGALDGALDEAVSSSCDSTRTAPYDIETLFVVPDDVEGPYAVELVVGALTPKFLRLRVD